MSRSIIYRTNSVNTVACTNIPNIEGHPLLFEIEPKMLPNRPLTSLYVMGLTTIKNTIVVKMVYLHLSAFVGPTHFSHSQSHLSFSIIYINNIIN
jgi:hypothetical protein